MRKEILEADENMNKYNLTSYQKDIWMMQNVYPNRPTYILGGYITFYEKVDYKKLNEALNIVIRENDSLRTKIIEKNGEPFQIFVPSVDYKIEFHNFSNHKESEKYSINWMQEEFAKVFNISTDKLFRIDLIKADEKIYYLLVKAHHLIMDGWGLHILSKRIVDKYYSLICGKEIEDKNIYSYKTFIENHDKYLNSERYKKSSIFWENKLKDLNEHLINRNSKYNKDEVITSSRKTMIIKREIYDKLERMAKDADCSTFHLFIAVLAVYFGRTYNKKEIVINVPIHNRTNVSEKNTIGLFTNEIPLRINLEENLQFTDLLMNIRNLLRECYRHQKFPINRVLKSKDIVNERISEISLSYINTDYEKEFEGHPVEVNSLTSKGQLNALTVFIRELTKTQDVKVDFDYQMEVFNNEFPIENVMNHIQNILDELLRCNNKQIYDIEMLTSEEKNKLMVEFNDTKAYYPENKTIEEIFEEQADKMPDEIAVEAEGKKLTYRELDEKSNSLARTLRKKGVGPDVVVGIMVERSVDMITGIMAILKAGGAYMPIDPECPEDRKEYMISNSKTNILLTQNKFKDTVKLEGQVLYLEDETLYDDNNDNLDKINKPNNLAYVIYTSGTTGKPKGVMIEHKNVINLVFALKEAIYDKYSSRLKIALVAPYFFDASVKQIFCSLLLGHSLYIIPERERMDGDKLINFYSSNYIDVTDGTPIHLAMIADADSAGDSNLELKHFIIGGDQLSKSIVKKLYGNLVNNEFCITNVYGPTECCVDTTCAHIYGYNEELNICIGKPLNNCQVYILNNDKMCPIGAAGELCIGGVGLARGYLNNEKLTKEKFVENPYKPGEKIYKTGDSARWLSDGNIECLGRIDDQVKIRGFRIELGEIESNFLKVEGIKEAVVLAKDNNGSKSLCAYYVSDKDYSIGELRKQLKSFLPDYMIPSYYMKLDNIPLTINGKVDKRSLPEPDYNIDTGVEYEAPKNEIEKKLVEIWKSVLGVNKIGINDSFFELGGDSIKSIQVISRAKSEGYYFEVKDLFENPTIKELSQCTTKNELIIDQNDVVGNAPLTPIQKWFFEMNFEEENYWNQSIMIFKKEGFSEEVLNKAFTSIITHHDALRMTYTNKNGIVEQFNRHVDEELFDLSIYDYRNNKDIDKEKIQEICVEIQESINLEKGPLVKLGLFKTENGDHLLIAVHHLVIDGISWRILFEDLAAAYKMAEEGKEIVLSAKTTSFKTWAEEQKRYAGSYDIKKELKYWEGIEDKDIKSLPKDKESEGSVIGDVRKVSVQLNEEETENLLKNVNRAYNTEINDILLTALGLTIKQWTGYEDILINLESHGREEIIKNVDITRTIGWFTSQYPVVINTDSEDISMVLKNTKDSLRRIPHKGIGYGIIKYLYDGEINFKLKPEISFNYLGQFDEDINNEIFSMSNLDAGSLVSLKNKNLYSLDFLAILINKKLNLNISYSSKEYNQETINELINNYKNNLIRIIEHCLNKENCEITASDITKEQISLRDLKPYLNEIYNI